MEHTFPGPGRYPATLTVDDGTGLGNATATNALVVTIFSPPVAVAGGNRDVCSGDPILFDASASRNPDGGRLRYAWDFGDGSTSDLVNPTKTYARPGRYPVTLTVRDEIGSPRGTAVDRIAALVREGPIAVAGPDLRGCTGAPVRFDGSASTDTDGVVNAYAWTFGDGGTGAGATPTHIDRDPGTYTVTLTITGDAPAQCSPISTDTLTVTIVRAAGHRIAAPGRAAGGGAVPFRIVLTDLDGAVPGETRWDFGDGATATGAAVEHVLPGPGDYSVTARTDLSGAEPGCGSLTATTRVTVNAAPEPRFDAPAGLALGEAVTFDALASTDPDGVIKAHSWDFGDGTAASGAAATHNYCAPGTYTVRLAVTDDAGVANSTAIAQRVVEVVAPPAALLADPGPLCSGRPVDWRSAPGRGWRPHGPSATTGRPRAIPRATPMRPPASTR